MRRLSIKDIRRSFGLQAEQESESAMITRDKGREIKIKFLLGFGFLKFFGSSSKFFGKLFSRHMVTLVRRRTHSFDSIIINSFIFYFDLKLLPQSVLTDHYSKRSITVECGWWVM